MELVLKDTCRPLIVSDAIFSYKFNEALVHQVIVAYASTSRQGTRAQKNRSEVTGSGRKPWRQKGTGRARAGSLKSPIWRSGGVTFAAKPKDYSQKINKKMYRGALKSIFSELIRQDRLIILENFSVNMVKTKNLVQELKKMDIEDVFIVTDQLTDNLLLSSRNLYSVNVCEVPHIDPISLISFNKVLTTAGAIKNIEEMLT